MVRDACQHSSICLSAKHHQNGLTTGAHKFRGDLLDRTRSYREHLTATLLSSCACTEQFTSTDHPFHDTMCLCIPRTSLHYFPDWTFCYKLHSQSQLWNNLTKQRRGRGVDHAEVCVLNLRVPARNILWFTKLIHDSLFPRWKVGLKITTCFCEMLLKKVEMKPIDLRKKILILLLVKIKIHS